LQVPPDVVGDFLKTEKHLDSARSQTLRCLSNVPFDGL